MFLIYATKHTYGHLNKHVVQTSYIKICWQIKYVVSVSVCLWMMYVPSHVFSVPSLLRTSAQRILNHVPAKRNKDAQSQWISLTCKSSSFSSLCAYEHHIGYSQNPCCMCYLRVVLWWTCTPDPLTTMLSGDREWFIKPLSWVWKDFKPRQYHSHSYSERLGWLFSDDRICMSLSNGVCWHGSRRTGKKQKQVTPLLKWEGGQHGVAELTNTNCPQFPSV